jgi:hypothetical protein
MLKTILIYGAILAAGSFGLQWLRRLREPAAPH